MSLTPPSRYRWIICALLFFATAINYTDRQILSLLKPMLDQQLHWSNEDFGWVNAFFQGAYGLGLLGFGWFIDRYGTKIGYAVAITVWSVAAIGHAFTSGVRSLIVARVVLGFGEGGNFPCAIKTVALWFSRGERAFATALFNAGSNVGAIVAPILVPLVALRWGWQSAFVIAGSAGFVWLIAWFLAYRSAPVTDAAENEPAEEKISWSRLLRYRATWAFIINKLILDPVWWFFLIWLPDYFNQTRGLNLAKSSAHLVTIYALTTGLGIVGSWLTGWWIKRGWSVTKARKTAMLIFALAMLPILFVARLGDWGAVIVLGCACASFYAYVSNMFSTVSDMFPRSSIASVVGLGGLAGCVSGMLFPVICGRLLDTFKAAGNITGGYALLFSICAFGGIAAFVLSHLLAPRFEPVKFTEAEKRT